MRPLLIAAPLMLLAAPAWSASIRVEQQPTVGVPGSTTFTFSVQTSPGEILNGVDARNTGALGQVNPLDMPTPFNDLNGFFGGDDVTFDSQFLFNSGDVLIASADESDTHLEASFSGISLLNLPNPTPIAQISTSDFFSLSGRFVLDLGDSTASFPFVACSMPYARFAFCVPEPGAILLLAGCLGGVAWCVRRPTDS